MSRIAHMQDRQTGTPTAAARIPAAGRDRLLAFQRNEITEHQIYLAFARRATGANRAILERIAGDEQDHYNEFRAFTGCDVPPDRVKVAWYRLCAAVFGFTFGIKLMERGEKQAEEAYAHFRDTLPEIVRIIEAPYFLTGNSHAALALAVVAASFLIGTLAHQALRTAYP